MDRRSGDKEDKTWRIPPIDNDIPGDKSANLASLRNFENTYSFCCWDTFCCGGFCGEVVCDGADIYILYVIWYIIYII